MRAPTALFSSPRVLTPIRYDARDGVASKPGAVAPNGVIVCSASLRSAVGGGSRRASVNHAAARPITTSVSATGGAAQRGAAVRKSTSMIDTHLAPSAILYTRPMPHSAPAVNLRVKVKR